MKTILHFKVLISDYLVFMISIYKYCNNDDKTGFDHQHIYFAKVYLKRAIICLRKYIDTNSINEWIFYTLLYLSVIAVLHSAAKTSSP